MIDQVVEGDGVLLRARARRIMSRGGGRTDRRKAEDDPLASSASAETTLFTKLQVFWAHSAEFQVLERFHPDARQQLKMLPKRSDCVCPFGGGVERV